MPCQAPPPPPPPGLPSLPPASPPLRPEDDVIAWLATAAARHPERPALAVAGAPGFVSYAQLYRSALQLGAAFTALVRVGGGGEGGGLDRLRPVLAIALTNSPAVVELHFGAAAARGCIVNLPAPAPAAVAAGGGGGSGATPSELATLLADARPHALVVRTADAAAVAAAVDELRSRAAAQAGCVDGGGGAGGARAADAATALAALRAIIWVGGVPPADVATAAAAAAPAATVAALSYEAIVAGGADSGGAAATAALPPGRHPDDAFQLYYTSGTTGEPKAVALSLARVAAHARLAARASRLHAHDVWLSAAPLFHLGAPRAPQLCRSRRRP